MKGRGLVVVLSLVVACARSRVDPVEARGLPFVIGPQESTAPPPPDVSDLPRHEQQIALALHEDVLALGRVEVIVGVPVTLPTADMSTAEGVQVLARAIEEAQDTFLRAFGRELREDERRYTSFPYLYLRVHAHEFGDLVALRKAGVAVSLEPNLTYVAHGPTSPPSPVPATLLHQSVPHIGAPAAWSAGFTGNNQTIVVIDTGVSHTHEFIAETVVAGSYHSVYKQGSCGTSGALQDCIGPLGVRWPGDPWTTHPTPEREHGTVVAGVVAGRSLDHLTASGVTQLQGVAPDATIVSIRVFSAGLGFWGATQADQIAALDEVYTIRRFELNIACVNMSLGSYLIPATQADCDLQAGSLKSSIEALRAVGIATVASTGDNWSSLAVPIPACLSSVIPVAQCDLNDVQPSNSNSASSVTLVAPGFGVASSIGPGSATVVEFGSSLAAPHVAGAIAILKQCKPNATVDEIYDALVLSAVPASSAIPGYEFSLRRIQVDAALERICP
jgi:subtilisin family serine protease